MTYILFLFLKYFYLICGQQKIGSFSTKLFSEQVGLMRPGIKVWSEIWMFQFT